jgi:TatD DNase family protein
MIDAHCHIDHYKNPITVAEEAERHGIITIAVTNLPSHFERIYPYFRKFKKIRLALGFHPQSARQSETERTIFERMVSKTSYIGEIGLDFSNENKLSKNSQIETLKFIFSNIKDRPRFITLHARKAESVVLALLEEFNIESCIFHWYSGPLTILEQAIESGHYFSINHAMTRSNKGRQIIRAIAIDHILTETDGPYIKLGNREVMPTDISSLLIALKDIYGLPLKEIEEHINSNFKRLISTIKLFNPNKHSPPHQDD